jgi:hypothetical protein
MKGNLRIEILDNSRDNDVIHFLDRLAQVSPAVLGYHYPIYRDMLKAIGIGEPLYISAWEGSQLVGVLPGFVKKSEKGSAYCSLPYFGPNAGVLCAPDAGKENSIHRALIGSALDYMQSQPDALTAAFYTPFLFDKFFYYEELMPEAVVVVKKTLFLDLPAARWDSKLQYDLRRAERAGLTVSSEVTLERMRFFYQIYEQNCIDYGIPLKPPQAIEYLMEGGVSEKKARCYFGYLKGKMVAGLMILYSPCTASYYIPCTLAEARTIQPGSMLIDRAIQDAKQIGIRYWNWESSPSPESGVYHFKKKWGSQTHEYRIYVQLFCDLNKLQRLGPSGLTSFFPHLYIYPYDRL